VYNCRTCQVDPTCVQCADCFHNANHTGHEVFFHITGSGGCCDCGDVEAWKAEGFCSKHSGVAKRRIGDAGDASADTTHALFSTLPEPVTMGLRSGLVHDAFRFVCHTAAQIKAAYAFTPTADDPLPYHVIVHNDDVHTVDQVCVLSTRACRERHFTSCVCVVFRWLMRLWPMWVYPMQLLLI
jgi:hypothetical protein